MILPDRFYIRRSDAEDLAIGIVAAIHTVKRPLYLYMVPSGRLGVDVFVLQSPDDRRREWLVGCYDAHASAGQIRDDIRACEYEPDTIPRGCVH